MRELVCIHGIHAHGDPVQSSVFEGLCQACQKVAIGGNGQIELPAVQGPKFSQIANKLGETTAQKRLTPGNPDFFDAQIHEDADHAQVIG